MLASASFPLIICFIAGIGAGAAFMWLGAVRPARRKTVDARTHARALESEVAAAAVRAATMRAESADSLRRIEELQGASRETQARLEAALTQTNAVDRALAGARATIDQMKLGEADVEARLQRVATTFVNEAREKLIASTAERFAGDAATFRERLVATVTPLNDRLEVLGASLTALGTARTQDQERVATLLEGLSAKMAGIDDATRRVERVLGNSQARGSWGEFELKRLLELTGMTEHVSFETQEAGYGTDGTGRPDVVLRIPGELTVPIDAKVPFARYQEAVSAASEAEREPLLIEAVAAVRGHVRALSARKYHDTPSCIGWTIMFVPIEGMLSTLFARDREIFELARLQRVLIASPLTLMLYLEAFSRGWAAQKQSENATIILEEARILVARLGVFGEKFGKVGQHLDSAIEKYNEAVGSYESRVAPQARKIVELRGDPTDIAIVPERLARARTPDLSRLPSVPTIPALTIVADPQQARFAP